MLMVEEEFYKTAIMLATRLYECFNEYDRTDSIKKVQFDISNDLYSLNQTERAMYFTQMQASFKKLKTIVLKIIGKMSLKYTRFLSDFLLRLPTLDVRLWTVMFGDSSGYPLTLNGESGKQSFYLPQMLFKELPQPNNGSKYSLVTYSRIDWKLPILTVDPDTLLQVRGEVSSLNVLLHDKLVKIEGLSKTRIVFSMNDRVLRKVYLSLT